MGFKFWVELSSITKLALKIICSWRSRYLLFPDGPDLTTKLKSITVFNLVFNDSNNPLNSSIFSKVASIVMSFETEKFLSVFPRILLERSFMLVHSGNNPIFSAN
jgi:hypothetical protein